MEKVKALLQFSSDVSMPPTHQISCLFIPVFWQTKIITMGD